jgi:hypothetical protein
MIAAVDLGCTNCTRQYRARPPSKECRPSCSWSGLLDQLFRDGGRVKGQLTITAGRRAPGATGISKGAHE